MKKLIILAIFSVLLCFSHGDEKIDPEPVVTTVPPSPTTTPSVPTKAPTTQPPTTHTPTTLPPTTPPTTPAPTTPSTKSTSTPVPTTHTPTPTPSPTPTIPTTAAPTSKPTPKPKPEVNTWVANYTGTNKTCIVLKMKLEIQVPYDLKINKTANATLYVPTTAEATGNCATSNATEQNITLTWQEIANITDSVTFNFKRNTTTNKFMLHSIQANIIPDAINFPNASSNKAIAIEHDKDEFLTPVAMSYRCKQDEYLPLAKNVSGKFVISNFQVQAFRNSDSKDFDSAKDCESGETPGIVPIAVGCSLAALIIIVLIAYLVGRRRSQARGYLSMFSEQQREAEYIPMKNISCFGK